MVEELLDRCKGKLTCKDKKITDITDLKLNILSRDDLPKQPDLQEKIEAIKEELVLSWKKINPKPKNTLAMLAIYAVKKGVINTENSIKKKKLINSE